MSQTPLSPTIKQNSLRDKKNNLYSHLEKSFEEYGETWQSFYPGLSFSFFINHFYEYCGNRFPRDSFFNQWFGGLIELKWKRYSSLLDLGKPLSYITKSGYFFETEFYVDERVLIPRFETEVLLEEIIKELNQLDKKSQQVIEMAEVGVGPGTLSLSVAQLNYKNGLNIVAGDLSQDALDVCRLNLFRLGFSIPNKNRVSLICSDRLAKMKGSYDLIYSNPPYIKKQGDLEDVHNNVVKNEPEVALFLEDEEYENWFQLFFEQVNTCLKEGGLFLMEGHEKHLQSLLKKIKETFSCEGSVIQDLNGRDRLLKIRKLNG